MQDYRVELDIYHGPLDLLLYLIRRDEIEIEDIPIAHITEQYMRHLETIKHLDINVAAEFLVMAATLMEIKSVMIAPKPEGEEDGDAMSAVDDPTDPRYELIHQLLAYKAFKDAARKLDERREEFGARFARQPAKLKKSEDDRIPELDMEDVQIWDVVEAFNRVMESIGKGQATHDVVVDDTPIELHMTDLADRLEREGPMRFREVFEGRSRGEMVGLFLATLELIRGRRLVIEAGEDDNDPTTLKMRLRSEEQVREILAREEEAEERGEVDERDVDAFFWPDEEQKQRYARRQELRERGERVEEDEEMEADIRELEAEEGIDIDVAGDDADASDEDRD